MVVKRFVSSIMSGASSDDHYLKQELDELVRSEPAIFDFLQKATLDGIWYWDLENRENEWMSDGFWELLGYDPNSKEHLASEWQDLIDTDDLQTALDNFAKHAEDPNHPYDQIVRYRHFDGSTVWVRCRGLAIRDAAGKPVRLLGAHLDITELKKAESKLQQAQSELEERVLERTLDLRNSEQRFRDFAESSSDWLWEMGPDLRFVFVSERYETTTGVPPERIVGRTHEELAEPEPDDPTWAQHLADMSARRPFRYFEYTVRNKDGDRVHFSTSGQPVFGPDGRFKGYRGVGRDITDRKLAEEALRAGKAAAEAATKAKSEFLATMSHELRTPLNAIIGFSDVLKSDATGPSAGSKAAEYAAYISDSGHHLLNLINDILDLSKVESGTVELQEVAVEPRCIIDAAERLVRQRACKQGIRLELEIPDDLPTLWADERKLKQILVNLLSNAVKFSNAGAHVTLKSWCRAEGGFVFQVVDTGIGIATQDIPKALSMFGQVDGDLSRRFEGTGLGLPLSKALVEQHGGSLDLQSQPGKGTTVTVRLPATRILWPLREERHGEATPM